MNTLKKLMIALLMLICMEGFGQYVSIPDSNFGNWLNANGYSSCLTGNNVIGWQMDTTCAAGITLYLPSSGTLSLANLNISDLTGIQYISWQGPGTGNNGLDLSHNNLHYFPTQIYALINSSFDYYLNLAYNHLDSFVFDANMLSLGTLILNHNGLHSFTVSGSSCGACNNQLATLDVSYNSLDTFPYLGNNNLGYGYDLNIRGNLLVSIPFGHYNTLDCGVNRISTFANNGLSGVCVLVVDSNLLTSIDLSGVSSLTGVMYKFDCSHNLLTNITNMSFAHSSLYGQVGTFLCNDNNLTSLPLYPNDLEVLDCHNNPSLYCIPNLPSVDSFTFNFSNTAIQCLPALYPPCIYFSIPGIHSLPPCLTGNTHGCTVGFSAGPDQTICQNSTLTAAAIGTGTWTNSPFSASWVLIDSPTSPTTIMRGFSQPGIYILIWSNGTLSDTMLVTVNAGPTADYTLSNLNDTLSTCPPATVCFLNRATGGASLRWTFGDAYPPDTASNPCHIWTITGDYPVTQIVSAGNGCVDSITKYSIHIGGPTVTMTAVVHPSCPCTTVTYYISSVNADSIQFTTSGGSPFFIYLGHPAGSAAHPALDTVTASYCNAGVVNPRLIAFDGSCQNIYDSLIAPITISTGLPSETVSASDTIIIPGMSTTITATGTPAGGSYQWAPLVAIQPFGGNAATVTATPPSTQTFQVIYTLGSCYDTAYQTIHVYQVYAGPDQTVRCVNLPGGTATMAALGSGTWTTVPGNPGSATITSPTDSITTITAFSTAGTYRFVWTNGGGRTDTADVIVTGTPVITDTITHASCGTNSGVICTHVTGGAPPFNYVWSSTGGNQSCLSNLSAGTYSCTVTDQNGCTASDSAVLPLTPSPTVSITVSPDSNIAIGENDTLIAHAPAGSTYSWSPATGIAPSPDSAMIFVAPSVATNYCVTATLNGCSSISCLGINVYPIFGGPDQTLSCVHLPGGSVTMGASGTGTWTALSGSPGTTVITSPTDPTTTITSFPSPGLYRYLWANGGGLTDTVNVTVLSYPYAGPDQTISIGDSVHMAATGTGRWSADANNPTGSYFVSVSDPHAIVYHYTVSGTYIYYWYNSGSCQDTMIVTVTGPSTCGFTANQRNGCGGFVLDLVDTTSGVGLTTSWSITLSNGQTFFTTHNNQASRFLNVPGVVNVTMTDTTNGQACTVSSNNFQVYPNPTIGGHVSTASPSINQCVTWIDSSSAGGVSCAPFNYQFDWGNSSAITNSPTTCAYYTSAGSYNLHVTITNACGCSTDTIFSNAITVSGRSCGITANQRSGCPGYVLDLQDTTSGAGQTASWSITLSNGQTFFTTHSNQASQLLNVPGVVNVTMTDTINGQACTVADSGFRVFTPLAVRDSVVNASCDAVTDGSIIFQVDSGTPPFTYTLSTFPGNTGTWAYTLAYTTVPVGTYTALVTDSNGCSLTLMATIGSDSDCVWPGDADNNRLVDNNDLLPIGLGYDSAGPARADTSIVWQAHGGSPWTDIFTNYTPAVNYKHADCNGDGIINYADTTAILQNFSFTHAKTSGPAPWRSGLPAIKAVLSRDTLYVGDTLYVSFILGDSVTTITDFYGLAFTYNFDPLVVDSTKTTMTFGPSWIGSVTDKISISKTLNSTGEIKAAVTRIDHITRSGSGVLATASFKITTDNISGKNYSYYANVGFISDITLIDNHGNIIPVNGGSDSSQVGFYPNGIYDIPAETIHLQPNPAHDRVLISAGNIIDDLTISNVTGQEVLHKSAIGGKATNVDVSAYDSGMYFVQIKTSRGSAIVKLVIEK